MIAEIVRSIATNRYLIKDVSTSRVASVTGDTSWRPGDRVVVIDSIIVRAAPRAADPEIVRV